jgi:hypothetical protein
MNLMEHKLKLAAYEDMLLELRALAHLANEVRSDWSVVVTGLEVPNLGPRVVRIPLDRDTAERALLSHIKRLTDQALDLALALNIDPSELRQ